MRSDHLGAARRERPRLPIPIPITRSLGARAPRSRPTELVRRRSRRARGTGAGSAYGSLGAHSWPDATRRDAPSDQVPLSRTGWVRAIPTGEGGFTLTSIPLAILAWIDEGALAWRAPPGRRHLEEAGSSPDPDAAAGVFRRCVRAFATGPNVPTVWYGHWSLGGGFATRI